MTQIGDGAFCDCSSLKSLTIPESVRKIGMNIARGCSSLRNLPFPDFCAVNVSKNVPPEGTVKLSPCKRRRRGDVAEETQLEAIWLTGRLTDENARKEDMVWSSAGVEIAEFAVNLKFESIFPTAICGPNACLYGGCQCSSSDFAPGPQSSKNVPGPRRFCRLLRNGPGDVPGGCPPWPLRGWCCWGAQGEQAG